MGRGDYEEADRFFDEDFDCFGARDNGRGGEEDRNDNSEEEEYEYVEKELSGEERLY